MIIQVHWNQQSQQYQQQLAVVEKATNYSSKEEDPR